MLQLALSCQQDDAVLLSCTDLILHDIQRKIATIEDSQNNIQCSHNGTENKNNTDSDVENTLPNVESSLKM